MSPRLQRLIPVLSSVLVLLVSTSALGYRWMTNTQEVSADEAVERYRAQASQSDAQPTDPEAADPDPALEVDVPAGPGVSGPATQQPARPPASGPATQPEPSFVPPPPPGVYTWKTQGWEEAGFRRNYPAETSRIVTTRDARTADNHHIFSSDHEEWFTLHSTDQGGVMVQRRMKVTFGPVTVDRTVVFDPPMTGVPIPPTVGAKWQGSWTGPTHGTYTGETVEQRTIRIGDEDIEVFVNELRITMRGESDGEIISRLWYSPVHRLMVREEGNYTMRGGPSTYRSEYTITLTSTQPRS